MELNITTTNFLSHGLFNPQLHILNANVTVYQTTFMDGNIAGNSVYIQDNCNGTWFNDCDFVDGSPGFYYIASEGTSYLIENTSFDTVGGGYSVIARQGTFGIPSQVTILNPTGDGSSGFWDATFDNSTLYANGTSTISLQWYKNVHVEDPDGNPIPNAPVWVKNRFGNPASPPMKLTNSSGWAKWFICTEKILYDGSETNFNLFNVSSENNSMIGYANPQDTIDQSLENFIVVPFSPPPPPSPSPPTGLSAKLSGSITNVKLTWNASADDGKGENDVVGYTVYKSLTGVYGSYLFETWIVANGSSSYYWSDLNAGDGDWNNYFYIVRANDTLDNEEKNINRVGKVVNNLDNEWNIFSVPLKQLQISSDYVLKAIEGNYATIQGHHAGKSKPWIHWHWKKPSIFNDIIRIDHKDGFYIKMNNSDYLVVAGEVPSNTQISLKAGWNLVGYPCLESKKVSFALSSISGSYNKVEFYNTTSNKEEGLGPNDLMHPGMGYWIHATADCIWDVPF
jgi:hypothetical protein